MIVIDSCALVEIAKDTDLGRAFTAMILNEERVVSVDFAKVELASVYRKMALRGEVTPEEAPTAYQHACGLVDEYYGFEDLMIESLNESIRLQHSAYDLPFFVLARRTGATLLTNDRALERLCLDNGVNCIAQVEF